MSEPTVTWYIAECPACDMKMPFYSEEERDQWADIHDTAADPFGRDHTTTRYEEQK